MTLPEIVKTLDEIIIQIKKLALEELKKLFLLEIREDYFDDDSVMTARFRAICNACGVEILAKTEDELIEEMIEHLVLEINAIKWGLTHLNYLTSEKLKKKLEEVDSDER